MRSRSHRNLLSTVGLILFALVAAGLSLAALSQNRTAPRDAVPPIAAPTSADAKPTEKVPLPTDSQPMATSESTPGVSPSVGVTSVVVIGDRHSLRDTPDMWLDSAEKKLGWGPVTNLSAAGRGYIKKPEACDIAVCANFEGSIPAVVAENPDVVITFGGTADGDRDLTKAAKDYFTALREALPDAEIIAISPVTSEDDAQYWLTLHRKTIRAGVESVGGTFIDVGQPGRGDGDYLSADAQAEIASTIIDELS